ncbi:hypothetical protein LINPERPRIM_LOCUS23648 [Linum perenne]
MHFNGILSGNEYVYESMAWFDQVDLDYLFMIELNGMAELLNVEENLFQYSWTKPREGIGDSLLNTECEDDVLAFTKAREKIGDDGRVLGFPYTLMTLYVKKLSEFEAGNRIGKIKMLLRGAAFERTVQFRLEEVNDDGDEGGVTATSAGIGLGLENVGMLLLP